MPKKRERKFRSDPALTFGLIGALMVGSAAYVVASHTLTRREAPNDIEARFAEHLERGGPFSRGYRTVTKGTDPQGRILFGVDLNGNGLADEVYAFTRHKLTGRTIMDGVYVGEASAAVRQASTMMHTHSPSETLRFPGDERPLHARILGVFRDYNH